MNKFKIYIGVKFKDNSFPVEFKYWEIYNIGVNEITLHSNGYYRRLFKHEESELDYIYTKLVKNSI